jgi:hypothetical protein
MEADGHQRAAIHRREKMLRKPLCSSRPFAHIHRGGISASRNGYHLRAQADFHPQQVYEMAGKLAQTISAHYARIIGEGGGLRIRLPAHVRQDLPLLQVLNEHGDLPPLTAVLGRTSKGNPFYLDFRQKKSWHLFTHGPSGTGKSELMRTVIVSLALNSQLADVQFLGIDLSGRELMLIEALPHALADVACEHLYAQEMLQWLVGLIERRRIGHIRTPHIFLAIDGVDLLVESGEMIHKLLGKIAHSGLKTGIHLLLTSHERYVRERLGMKPKMGFVIARAAREEEVKGEQERKLWEYRFLRGFERTKVQIAWMPAFDLQEAVRLIRSGQWARRIRADYGQDRPVRFSNSIGADQAKRRWRRKSLPRLGRKLGYP